MAQILTAKRLAYRLVFFLYCAIQILGFMRKLAAIMFTDIVGYSAMMSHDERHALSILEKNRAVHKAAISEHNGEYIKEIGDGTLAIFQSSLDAVNCAIRIMKTCKQGTSFSLRIGIHIGDIIFSGGDVFGEGVNIASRIEAGGKAGGIYVSERVYEDIKNHHEIIAVFIDERVLKNIDHPVRIYSIDFESSTLPEKNSIPIFKRVLTPIKPDRIKKSLKSRLVLLAGIITLIVSGIIFLMIFLPHWKAEVKKNRIVVAIFENRTGNASLDMIGKMATDWITQGLSRSLDVYVVPGTTVMQISTAILNPGGGKISEDYLSQLARETKSDIIVSGSYYLQKETLQFNAEVKNIENGAIIYALPAITGSLQQPAEIIEKLGSEIFGGLAFHFRVSDVRSVSKPPDLDTYSEYIAGMELFAKDYEGSIQHLLQAVKMDPLFFPPQYELAWAYINQGKYAVADSIARIINRNRERLSPFERYNLESLISAINGNYTESLRNTILAENISPGDWSVNYSVGCYAAWLNKQKTVIETYSKFDGDDYYYGSSDISEWRIVILADAYHLIGDYEQEIVESLKGQKVYPDCLWLYAREVSALAAMGKIEELEGVINKCLSISSISGTVGDVLTFAALEFRAHGNNAAAHEYAIRAVDWYERQPVNMDFRGNLATAFYFAESWAEAKSIFAQLASEFPDNINYMGYIGAIAARTGDRQEAEKVSGQLSHLNHPYLYGQHIYWQARIAALLGESGQAVKLLRESFAEGKIFEIGIHNDPDFHSLYNYEPFIDLMRPKE